MRQERDDELPPLSSFADGRYGRKPRAPQPTPPRAAAPEPRRQPAASRPTTPAPRAQAPEPRRPAPARAPQTPRTVTARPRKTQPQPAPDYDIDFQTSQAAPSAAPRPPQPIINFKSYHIARQTQTTERVEVEAEPMLAMPATAPDCPRCHGAGYVRVDVPMGHPLFGKAIACHCKEDEMETKRRNELWRMSSLDAFEHMTFASFNPKIPGAREAWEVASQYGEDPDGWLVLSGPCGSGKTHLAAAIANVQFGQGAQVLFVVVPKLLDHLRSSFAPSSDTTYDALFTKICEAGLLVLDDMGAEHTTAWAQDKLFQLLNHRYMYGLPTVITTNLDLMNEMDDRVRSRLNDVSLVRHVRLTAEDFRPRHVPQHRRGTN